MEQFDRLYRECADIVYRYLSEGRTCELELNAEALPVRWSMDGRWTLNIAYGDDRYSVDEVINAADIANAHEFIVRQPDGYDSVLGERGVGLSGGERQRLSIARAMLRNPKMLVFDEATASVDSETEHLIQEAIEHLISGRTTIMIAHRLSTLSKANKIVVVDNGSIIECGTPQELMEQKGKYYRLVQIQSMSDQVAQSRRDENFD